MTSSLSYFFRALLAYLICCSLGSVAFAQAPATPNEAQTPTVAPPAPTVAPAAPVVAPAAPTVAPAAPAVAPATPAMSLPTGAPRSQIERQLQAVKQVKAQPEPPTIPATDMCPSENLLAGLKPILPTSSVERSLKLTDGEALKEGTTWDVAEATIIKVGGKVTYDLGRGYPLSAFTLQGDNNDIYEVYGSTDGKAFNLLWKAGAVKGAGLRYRSERLKSPTSETRYVQLRASGGDKSYSVSELQVFCATPSPWPPKVEQVSATTQKSSKDARKHFIGRAKIGVGLIALLIFFIPRLMRRAPEEDTEQEGAQPEGKPLKAIGTIMGYDLTEFRNLLVWVSALASTASMTWLGIQQVLDAYQRWTDNGLISKVNGYFPVVFDGLDHQEIAFLNGAALCVVSLFAIGYVIKLMSRNSEVTAEVVNSLETLGFISLVWVVMTQADELLGKTSAWWPKGWEGLAVASLMTLIFMGLHLLRNSAVRRLGWLTAVLLGLMTWVSLGSFHGNRITHFWDSYHYYVGSKYFAENRYHLIYHCTILAERDDGREEKLKGRALRNLVDNEMTTADDVLDDSNELVKECRAHFTPQRWEAFKQDTRLFRSYMGESWWAKMFKDHGYNATPVWTFMGSLISQHQWEEKVPPAELVYTPQKRNGRSSKQLSEARKRFYDEDRPRFEKEIIALNFIDLSLYALMFLLFLWAFGLETTAFIALVFGIGYPWSYDWTGGSFGRIPWLFTAVSGLCFLKRGFPALGGFALGWSLLLRVFPGAVLGGAGLQILLMIFKKDPWTKTYKRFMIGGLTSLALLVPISLITGQGVGEGYRGVSVYKEFINNSLKHKNTPLTNNMGLPTVLAYHPNYTVGRANVLQRRMESKTKEKKPNFWLWKTKHRELKKSRMWLQLLLILGMFAFLYRMRTRWELWEMTAASVVFIFCIFELTCYYYSFLVLLAPLAFQRAKDIFGLLTIGVASQVIQIRIGATDIEYLWESIFVLAPMLIFVLGRTLESGDDPSEAQGGELLNLASEEEATSEQGAAHHEGSDVDSDGAQLAEADA